MIPDYPITDVEKYLNMILTDEGEIPDYPNTRIEKYLYAIMLNGIGKSIKGYYYDGQFYADIDHTQLITPQAGKIYYDLGGGGYLFYNGSSFGRKADLLPDGKVPLSQLPDFVVADVVEVQTYADLPTTGDSGKVYNVKNDPDSSKNGAYKWIGDQYFKYTNEQNYYNVSIVNSNYTMGQLHEAVDDINLQGQHVLFDLHNFASEAYVCTIHFYTSGTDNYCEIFDILNQKVVRGAFEDTDLVSDFCETMYKLLDSSKLVTMTATLTNGTTKTYYVMEE